MTSTADGSVLMYAVGDVGPTKGFRPDPATHFDHVRDGLKKADISFCQLERLFSTRGTHNPLVNGGADVVQDPESAKIIPDAGFDVVSLASNHAGDWTRDVLTDTKAVFRELGVETAGAGFNIEEAREPAILNRNGVRVAVLAYCSVNRDQAWATENRPGVSPIRVRTSYEADYQPGSPVTVITFPYADDLAAMVEDIRKAREEADVVVMSIHWGIHFLEKVIATYQPLIGHAAIDAGADVVLGHHAHVVKAVEVYKGKPIYYSLGNFAFDTRRSGAGVVGDNYGIPYITDDDPTYPFSPEARNTLVATLRFSKQGLEQAGYRPAYVERGGLPVFLERSDPRFDDLVAYVDWASDENPYAYTVEGDEIVFDTTAS
jgi:hypothetical protein